MKNKLISLIGGLLCGFAVLTGCAGGVPFFSSNPTVEQSLAKIAIQQATLRAIQAKGIETAPARAKAVVRIVDQAQAVLSSDKDAVVSPADLDVVLEQVLPKDLTPADKLLVAQLTSLVIAEVGASIPVDQQKLPVAEISAVLGWIKEAADLAAPQS